MYICIYSVLGKALALWSVMFVVVVVGKGVRLTASRVEVGSQCSDVTVYLLCVGIYMRHRTKIRYIRRCTCAHAEVCQIVVNAL